ncbi:MAG: ABC transporter permease [Spirochaetales bacterium]|jgi:ABC-type lipoprotein release transport system permease subunit|nr:ABC transporter permease [Spirochaetales bacterium]
MKLFQLIQLSVKYLYRNLRRYFFLLLAVGFGFCIVTLITSLSDGMTDSVYYSAQAHYAGDIMIAGYKNATGTRQRISETNQVLQAISAAHVNPAHIVQRTIFPEQGMLFYNGIAVRQKYVIGVDWQNETEYFRNLNWDVPVKGNLSDGDAIISDPVAREFKAQVGDQITLEVETETGQKNTGVFIIRGIVKDSTIFGYYKCYLSRAALNRLLLFSPEECSIIGIYLRSRGAVEKAELSLQAEMEKALFTSPLVADRGEFRGRREEPWQGIRHFVLTLAVQLSEVSDLLRAMQLITYFLYAMMLLIILVSATVTYRLILRERTREIATMRAIGFYEGDIRIILLFEVFFLCIIAVAAGYAAAMFFAWLASFLPFDWMPSFEIFMKNGRLEALFLPATVLLNVFLVLSILIPAVWFPAFAVSRNPLPEMLSGGGRV